MPHLTPRAKTLVELAENALFLASDRPLKMTEKAQNLLTDDARAYLGALCPRLAALDPWDHDQIELCVKGFAEEMGLKLGKIAQPLRAALCGSTVSPGIFDVLLILGQEECLARIQDQSG